MSSGDLYVEIMIVVAVVWGAFIIYKVSLPAYREKRRKKQVLERGKGGGK